MDSLSFEGPFIGLKETGVPVLCRDDMIFGHRWIVRSLQRPPDLSDGRAHLVSEFPARFFACRACGHAYAEPQPVSDWST